MKKRNVVTASRSNGHKHLPLVVQALLKEPRVKLDVGCGASLEQGWIGLDIQQDLPGSGLINHDIENYPWPLPDESVDLVKAAQVVEHISPAQFGFIKWMNEVWRVLKIEGQLMIAMPYGVSAGFLQDPTHCNPRNEHTWRYFDPLDVSKLYRYYHPKPWKILSCQFDTWGNMEVALEKRRFDPEYLKIKE